MNRHLIVLVDYSGGAYSVHARPKYVADDINEAVSAVKLMNEVMNYNKFRDEDGEWFGTHFEVREIEVWNSASA